MQATASITGAGDTQAHVGVTRTAKAVDPPVTSRPSQRRSASGTGSTGGAGATGGGAGGSGSTADVTRPGASACSQHPSAATRTVAVATLESGGRKRQRPASVAPQPSQSSASDRSTPARSQGHGQPPSGSASTSAAGDPHRATMSTAPVPAPLRTVKRAKAAPPSEATTASEHCGCDDDDDDGGGFMQRDPRGDDGHGDAAWTPNSSGVGGNTGTVSGVMEGIRDLQGRAFVLRHKMEELPVFQCCACGMRHAQQSVCRFTLVPSCPPPSLSPCVCAVGASCNAVHDNGSGRVTMSATSRGAKSFAYCSSQATLCSGH
jgi:hypothetical protein